MFVILPKKNKWATSNDLQESDKHLKKENKITFLSLLQFELLFSFFTESTVDIILNKLLKIPMCSLRTTKGEISNNQL